MTAVPLTTPSAPSSTTARPELRADKAPLGRLLRAELSWVFHRPRTVIALILLALVPIVIAIGIQLGGGPRGGPGGGSIYSTVIGNGFVLPVVALTASLTLLLPLITAMWSADAIAGEAANGTLRGLLIAPISRSRLLAVKAFGVAVAVLAACVLIVVVGAVTGLIVVGAPGMITLSGTTLSSGAAIGRLAIAAGWVAIQVWAVGAIALAISTCTEHPLVVMAATIAGAIVFGVLSAIPSLSFLQPYLLTNSWTSLVDVLRDPMPLSGLLHGLAEAACYLVIGLSVALARMVTRDG
jgi:ABC-2 type transport system permease protein